MKPNQYTLRRDDDELPDRYASSTTLTTPATTSTERSKAQSPPWTRSGVTKTVSACGSPSRILSISSDTGTVPRDNRCFVHFTLFVAGVSMLLPWNALITATAYFSLKFKGSAHEDKFLNYFSFASTFTNFLGLGLALVLQKKNSMWSHVQWGMLGNVAIFVFLTITTITSMGSADTFFYVMISLVVLSSAAVAWHQNALFGIAAQFPAQYTASVMSGQGAAGVAVAVADLAVNIAAVSRGTMTEEAILWSSFHYFLFATLVSVLGLILFHNLKRLPFYNYYTVTSREREENEANGSPPAITSDRTSTTVVIQHDDIASAPSSVSPTRSNADYLPTSAGGERAPPITLSVMASVIRQIAVFAFSVFFVFVVTLAVYPSVTAFVEPVVVDAPEMYKQTFTGIHYLIFNVGDWLGRTLPALPGLTLKKGFHLVLTSRRKPFMVRSKVAILSFSLLRILFVPALVFCNVVTDKGPSSSVLFGDGEFFAIMLALAITNGWLGSLTMMEAPTYVAPENSSLAGTLMAFILTFGLFVGSIMSFIVSGHLSGRPMF